MNKSRIVFEESLEIVLELPQSQAESLYEAYCSRSTQSRLRITGVELSSDRSAITLKTSLKIIHRPSPKGRKQVYTPREELIGEKPEKTGKRGRKEFPLTWSIIRWLNDNPSGMTLTDLADTLSELAPGHHDQPKAVVQTTLNRLAERSIAYQHSSTRKWRLTTAGKKRASEER